MANGYTFVPVDVETFSIIGSQAAKPVRQISACLRGESREISWLFQKITIDVAPSNTFDGRYTIPTLKLLPINIYIYIFNVSFSEKSNVHI